MGEGIKSVASQVVDVFRTSPGLLFVVLLNIFFLGGLGYLLLAIGDRRADEFQLIVKTMNDHFDDVMRLCFKVSQVP